MATRTVCIEIVCGSCNTGCRVCVIGGALKASPLPIPSLSMIDIVCGSGCRVCVVVCLVMTITHVVSETLSGVELRYTHAHLHARVHRYTHVHTHTHTQTTHLHTYTLILHSPSPHFGNSSMRDVRDRDWQERLCFAP